MAEDCISYRISLLLSTLTDTEQATTADWLPAVPLAVSFDYLISQNSWQSRKKANSRARIVDLCSLINWDGRCKINTAKEA